MPDACHELESRGWQEKMGSGEMAGAGKCEVSLKWEGTLVHVVRAGRAWQRLVR